MGAQEGGKLVRKIRVVYEDGTTEVVELSENVFGLEGTTLHGPVKSVTLAERVEDYGREDRNLGRGRNKLERSVAA